MESIESKTVSTFYYYQCWKTTIESTQHLSCYRYSREETPSFDSQRMIDRVRGQTSLPLFKLHTAEYEIDTEKETNRLRFAFGINKGRVNIFA